MHAEAKRRRGGCVAERCERAKVALGAKRRWIRSGAGGEARRWVRSAALPPVAKRRWKIQYKYKCAARRTCVMCRCRGESLCAEDRAVPTYVSASGTSECENS